MRPESRVGLAMSAGVVYCCECARPAHPECPVGDGRYRCERCQRRSGVLGFIGRTVLDITWRILVVFAGVTIATIVLALMWRH